MSIRIATSVLTFVLAIVAATVLVITGANAQNQTGGSGLQVSPTRTEISGQPGEVKDFTITLRNITNGELTAQAFISDFQSDGESGTPQIIVDNEQNRSPYSLINLIKGLNSVDLKPNEVKEVKLKVDIPGNTAPGAYFGAIRFAAIPKGQQLNDSQRQVALTASVAHLVFLEVPGNIVEQIKVEKLILQSGDKNGSFFLKAPDKSNVTVKNLGNGFSRPFGKVTIDRALFGGQVYSYDINNQDPRGIVLPNSTRTFTDEVKNIKIPGKYTATASVAYGSGGEVVNYKTSFWYMPLWLIILLVVLLIALIVGIVYIYRKNYTYRSKKK